MEFVECVSTEKAVAFSGSEVMGRPIRVDYAKDKIISLGGGSPGDRGGGGGRGGMGGGRGGYGGGRGGRGGGYGSSPRRSPTSMGMSTGRAMPFEGKKIKFSDNEE